MLLRRIYLLVISMLVVERRPAQTDFLALHRRVLFVWAARAPEDEHPSAEPLTSSLHSPLLLHSRPLSCSPSQLLNLEIYLPNSYLLNFSSSDLLVPDYQGNQGNRCRVD